MNISKLNQRAVLQKNEFISDGMGGALSLWKDIESVWVKISEIKFIAGGQSFRKAICTHKIIIKSDEIISSNYRLKVDNKVFVFKSIKTLPKKNNYKEIMSIEAVI